ncbi:MAG: MarR family transcriptional regulator [Proteobacteria bacterium]|nr:MarR family transcriptional regulator [Pseudomonadota bacterium]
MARSAVKTRHAPTLDLGDYLPYLVNRVGVRLVAAFSREAEKFGLSVPMWRVLAVLAEDGAQRQIDLAQRTSIDASTLSRLIRTVQQLGYVTRARSAASLREVTVGLTARGREVVSALIPFALACEGEAARGLSQRELDVLKALLQRVYANLE